MADNTAGQTRTPTLDRAVPGVAVGKIVYDGTTITAGDDTFVNCGFTPRYVRVMASGGVSVEWFAGMAEGSAFKEASDGTRTLSASVGIKTDPRGFRISQNATLAAILASSTVYYFAQS